jgi:hypothetical protein
MFRILSIILILTLTLSPFFAQEELNPEELEELEGYGQTAYFIYLIGLVLLGVGVIIAGLLIQNNMGTKNMLIFTALIILIAAVIVFY